MSKEGSYLLFMRKMETRLEGQPILPLRAQPILWGWSVQLSEFS